MPFIYLFCLLHASSSQINDVITAAITRRASGDVKPEVGNGVELRRRVATRVARCTETGRSCDGVVRYGRCWWSSDEHPVVGAATDAGVDRGGGGSEMSALGVGGLTTPLDASVLKPDFDLSLDESELSG